MRSYDDIKQFIQTGSESVLQALGDAISIQDKDLRILYQNSSHVSMMGSHLGEYCYTAYQGKADPCPGCHLLESFKDGLVHKRITSTSKPDRGTVHVEILSTPLKDANGEIIGGIESVRDITDRVLMEEKLVKQLTAIETAMDGIALLNSMGNYTFLNKAHAEVYGYNDPSELLGKSWQILYASDELDRIQNVVFPRFMEDGKWQGEATGRKKDGTPFPQELSLALTEDGGIVCVVRDISARKYAEEKLHNLNLELQKQASELMSTNSDLESFSYTLSHDIRNYLARISTAADAVTENYSKVLDETGNFLVSSISEACDGMENLIQTILMLSRISRTDLPLDTVDLSELAIEVGHDLRYQYPAFQVDYSVQPELTAYANKDLLKVMLTNLLGNAWKYTSRTPKASVTFGAVDQGGKRVFFVKDNGIGFDMQDAEHLFKPFNRLGTACNYKGVGLGLATVQRIIHAHGGDVWGEGEPGKGATFYFTLC